MDLESVPKGGGPRLQKYEYALRHFVEESKKRGAFEKVKVVNKVRDTNDYNAEPGGDRLKMIRSEKLQKFIRETSQRQWESLVNKRNVQRFNTITLNNT